MKKLLIILSFLYAFNLTAQTLSAKWIKVWDLPEQQVYVDTSTVKQYENQISVLSISFYKEPQLISSINKKVTSIKSRVLFNIANQRYSVIGTLFYDAQQRILAESSLPGSSSGGEAFSVPIDSNQVMVAIYAYCVNLLNVRDKNIADKDFSISGDKTRSLLDKAENDFFRREEITKSPTSVETFKPVDKLAKKDSLKKDFKKIDLNSNRKLDQPEKKVIKSKPAVTKPVSRDSTIKVVDPNPLKDDALKSLVAKKQANEKGIKESNPKSTIFTDGSKYSFQVSSWKNKAKAESEISRLKKEGHNAFIVEAYVAERKGNWYRVRIGYFNSIEETETYMKKLK